MPKKRPTPAYTRHSSGQARVRIDGKVHYLGLYGTPESRERYDELIAAWLARQDVTGCTLNVGDLCLLYLKHADAYYRKNGQPTGEVVCIKAALRLLCEFDRRTKAREFGPKQLRTFRDSLVQRRDARYKKQRQRTLSRQYINKVVRKVVRMFKWAATEELIPVAVWQALTTVEGLKKGRTNAREARKVRPVEDQQIEAVLPHVVPQIAAMIRLQRLTGMRPGEVVELRPCDVTMRTDGIWCYRPARFKTEHHEDAERIVFIGPQGQGLLRPWLDRDPSAYCFSPREAMRWYTAQKRAKRKTRVQPSQSDRTKPDPQKQPGESYTEQSYRKAIQAACRKQKIAVWSPNQIRHRVGTLVRQRFGLEASQVTLGHATADVTQVYAERNQRLAADVARHIG